MEMKTPLSKFNTVKPCDPSCLSSLHWRLESMNYVNVAWEAHPVPVLMTSEGCWFLGVVEGSLQSTLNWHVSFQTALR